MVILYLPQTREGGNVDFLVLINRRIDMGGWDETTFAFLLASFTWTFISRDTYVSGWW